MKRLFKINKKILFTLYILMLILIILTILIFFKSNISGFFNYYLFSKSINLINLNSLLQIIITAILIANFNNLTFVQKKAALLFISCLMIYFFLSEYSTIAIRIRELSLITIIPLFFSEKLKLNIFTLLALPIFYFILIYNLISVLPRLLN